MITKTPDPVVKARKVLQQAGFRRAPLVPLAIDEFWRRPVLSEADLVTLEAAGFRP